MRTEEDFAADNRRKLRIIAAIGVPCVICLAASLVFAPPPPTPPERDAALRRERVDATSAPVHTLTEDAGGAMETTYALDAAADDDASHVALMDAAADHGVVAEVANATEDSQARVASIIERINAKLSDPYDPAQATAYDAALAALDSEASSIAITDRTLRRDLHRARSTLTRRRRSIHRDVLEREGEALARDTCGASPPDLADDNGRRMFQRGFFIEHRDDPGEELLRCGPMTLAPVTCWRIACVTSSLRSVEFLWRRGAWTSMRYLR